MDIKKFVEVTISRRFESRSVVSGVRPSLLVGITATTDSTDYILGLIDKVFTNAQDILDYKVEVDQVDQKVFNNTDEIYLEAEAYFMAGGTQLRLAIVNSVLNIAPAVRSANDIINFKVVRTAISKADYGVGTFSLANALSVCVTINGTPVDNVITTDNKILYYDLTLSEWATIDNTTNPITKQYVSGVEGLAVFLVNSNTDYVGVKSMAYVSSQNFKAQNIKELLYTNFIDTPVIKAGNGKELSDISKAVGYGTYNEDLRFNAYMNITPGVNALLGGKDTTGYELVSKQNSIAAQIDLTTRLLTYLIDRKPTFSGATISETYNLLTDYLDKVALSGWLTSQRVNVEDVQNVVKNGISYPLLSRGEILEYGYKVVILPFSRADITERVFKDIYVFLGTTKGIQKIVLKGDIM